MKDTLFQSEKSGGKFRFDEKVARVFDDMLSRSVPFYGEVQKMIAGLAADRYRPGEKIYDLGCSTGTTIVSLCEAIEDDGLRIIGVDSSKPVIEKARGKITDAGFAEKTELVCANIMDVELSKACVVIMNYTLQFIPPELRIKLLGRIHDALSEGSILLLSEKVLENDPATSDLFIEKYHAFKRDMGYSEMEIAKKREALDQVLIPFTFEKELELLSKVGFSKTSIFFKWFNFASFMAVK